MKALSLYITEVEKLMGVASMPYLLGPEADEYDRNRHAALTVAVLCIYRSTFASLNLIANPSPYRPDAELYREHNTASLRLDGRVFTFDVEARKVTGFHAEEVEAASDCQAELSLATRWRVVDAAKARFADCLN